MSGKSGRASSWAKGVLSVVLSVSMAFGGVPMAAYAEAAEELVETSSAEGRGNEQSNSAGAGAGAAQVGDTAGAGANTTQAGESAGATDGAAEGAAGSEEQAPTYTWTIDEAGLLTIAPAEGKDGTLPSNTESAKGFYPWAARANDVRSIRVENGVKAQGSIAYLFASLPNLESADLTGLSTSEATNTTGLFEGSGSLVTFVVGSDYDLSKADAIPASRAKDGRWWSEGAKAWFTASEIVATRATTADTYASEGPAEEPSQQPEKGGSESAGQPSATGEPSNEEGKGQQQGDNGSGKETLVLGAQDSGDTTSFENFTASCVSVARFDNGDGTYTLRPWGIQLLDTNNDIVNQSEYDVTVEPTDNTNWGATVTVTFSARQDNSWGYTGSKTTTSAIGVNFDSNLLVAHNTVISRDGLDWLKSDLSCGNYYPDLTYNNARLYSEIYFDDGNGWWPEGEEYRIISATESNDGKTALITIAPREDDPVYYGQKTITVAILDNSGSAVLDLSQATNIELGDMQTCWVANGNQIKPKILSFDVPAIRDGEQIGSQRCYNPQETDDFTVSYVDNVFGNATTGKGTIVVAASDNSPYAGSFSYEFDILNLGTMDLSQDGFTVEAVNPDAREFKWLVREGGVRPDVRCVVNCEYNGQAVYKELEGSDLVACGLTLSYTDNTSVGTGHVTVSNSNSQKTADFPIVSSVPIWEANVSLEKDEELYVLGVYPDMNNEADYTKPKFKETDVFKENTDFVYGGYTYEDRDENGNRECIVRFRAAQGSTHYTNEGLEEGQWAEKWVTLHNKKDFSKCQIKFVDDTYEYNCGNTIYPKVQLIAEDGQTVLVDSDSWPDQSGYYMDVWQENADGEEVSPSMPGEATVRINCYSYASDYLGEPLLATYTIVPLALSTERVVVDASYNNLTEVYEGTIRPEESIGDWAAQNSSMSIPLGDGSYAWLGYGTDFEYESCEPEWTGQPGTYTLTYKGIGSCAGTFTVPVTVVSNNNNISQLSLECDLPDVYTDGDLELRLTTGDLGDNVTYEFVVEAMNPQTYEYVPVPATGYTVDQENRTITLHGTNLTTVANRSVRVSVYAKVDGRVVDQCERYISVYEPGSVYQDLRLYDETLVPTQWYTLPKSGIAYYRNNANPQGIRFDYTTVVTVSNQSPTYAGYDVIRVDSEGSNWKISALNPGTATVAVERTRAEQMGGGTETVTFVVTVTEDTSDFEAQIQGSKNWTFPNGSVTAQVTGSYQRWSVAKQEFEDVDDGLTFEWQAAGDSELGEGFVTVSPTVADGGRTATISFGALPEGFNDAYVSIWVQPKHDGENIGVSQYTSVNVVKEHLETVLNPSTEDYRKTPVGGSFTVRPEVVSYSVDKVSPSNPDGREVLGDVTFTWSEWAGGLGSEPPHSFDIVGPSADGTYTFTRLLPGYSNYQLSAYRDSTFLDGRDLYFDAVGYDVRLSAPHNSVYADGNLTIQFVSNGESLPANVEPTFDVKVQVGESTEWTVASETCYGTGVHPYTSNYYVAIFGSKLSEAGVKRVKIGASVVVDGRTIECDPIEIDVLDVVAEYNQGDRIMVTGDQDLLTGRVGAYNCYFKNASHPDGDYVSYTITDVYLVDAQGNRIDNSDHVRVSGDKDANNVDQWTVEALSNGSETVKVEYQTVPREYDDPESGSFTYVVTVAGDAYDLGVRATAGTAMTLPGKTVELEASGRHRFLDGDGNPCDSAEGLTYRWSIEGEQPINGFVTFEGQTTAEGENAVLTIGNLPQGHSAENVKVKVELFHDGQPVRVVRYLDICVRDSYTELCLATAEGVDLYNTAVGDSVQVTPELRSYSSALNNGTGYELIQGGAIVWDECDGLQRSENVEGDTYTFTRTSADEIRLRCVATWYDQGERREETAWLCMGAKANLSNATIAAIPNQAYTGAGIEPAVTVRLDGRTVSADEYTVAYANNTNVGQATVTVTAKAGGNYIGSTSATFTITPLSLADATIELAQDALTYDGSELEPAVASVTVGEHVLPASGYTVAYTDNQNAGQATVTVTGTGNYNGTATKNFTIVPLALSSESISITGVAESTPYTGAHVTMPIEVGMGENTTLQPINLEMPSIGDYAVAYENNQNAGLATVTITGHNNFTGTVTKTFQITSVALDSESVIVSGIEDKEFTGSPITQEDLALTLGNYTLVENRDYEVSYTNNINKGEATITITAKSAANGGSGNFTDRRTETFKITGKVLNDTEFTVSAIDPTTYTGNNITPEPTVTYGSSTLIKGTDYTLSYANNKNATTSESKATVTITGAGDYGGELIREFEISPAAITQITGVQSLVYTGDPLTQTGLGVKAGSLDLEAGDYDVAYTSNTDAGQATVAVTAKGNYTGQLSQTFEIEPMSIAGATVTLEEGPFTYTGSTIEPAVTSVSVDGKTVPTSGYTVAYDNNQDAGQATVTVTGTGNYKDATTANFTIGKKSLEGAAIASIPNKTYTGSAIEPAIAVVQDGTEVSADEYDVTYANNTSVAAADAAQPTVTATAKADGNYTGSISTTFSIVPRSLEDATVEGIASTVAFKNAAYEPVPTVTIGDKTLVKDTHYTVAYANNKDASAEGSKATVTIAGMGNYTGSKVVEFTIAPAQITAIEGVTDLSFTGDALTQPGLVVWAGDLRLAPTDYDVEYASNVNATTDDAKATVTVTAKGNYRGTLTEDFSIVKASMGSNELSVTGVVDKSYNGTAQTQDTLVIKLGSYALVEGRDYTVAYANNVSASTEQNKAKITLTGQGNIMGSKVVEFTIAGRSLSEATIDGIADQTYTGKAIEPDVKVSIDDRLLVEDTDYTVTYGANNTNVTDAVAVTVTGIGNYAGEATTSFRIVPLSLARAVVTAGEQAFTGAALEPTPTVKVGDKTIGPSVYNVAYENNTNVGTATIIVRPKDGQTNYADTGKGTFRIKTRSISEDNQLAIAAITDQPYTGSAIKPEVSVTLNGQAFPAANYTVSYSDNTNVGQATVTITGKGSYSGTKTATFQIVPVNMANVTVSGIEDKMHTGEALTQDNLVLRLGDYVLKEGTDYTVSYDGNTNVGMATVTITGSGNFTGTRTENFNIGSLQIADIAAFTYDGTEHKPKPAVVAGEQTLTEGTDFDYAWSSNVDAGTAKVTVTGKGEYAGSSANKEFAINPAPLGALAITAIGDQPYTGAAITPEVVIDNLTKGRDYTVSYNNNVNAGVATAIATGTGNYAGKLTTTFGIGAKNLADADVSVTDIPEQTYTGKAIKPSVEVRVGNEVLDPKNYEVAYENNTSTGTANVTITGKGNYAGTKTTSFTIAQQSLAAGNVLIGAISDQTYTGSEVRPVPTITVNGRKLDISDTSKYEVTYENNTDVGTATVTVKAIGGDYTGEKSQTFKIKVRNIADYDVTVADQTYTGHALTPELTLSRDGILSSDNYDVEYANNSDAGVAVVTITGKGNCTGTTTTTFAIAPATITEVTGVADLDYTGTALTQNQLVVKAGENLTLGAGDYDVTYANNTNATTADAKATVTVTGKGNFTGSQSAEFAIAPMGITGATVTLAQDSFTYNGSTFEPAVSSVVVGGKALGAGDYDVTYASNTNTTTDEAKATVTVTGKGNYKDTATANFSIAKANLADVTVTGVADLQYQPGQSTYTQNESNVVLKLGDYTLRQGTDYTISYANHTGIDGVQDLYTATLTIQPAGSNFEGEALTRDFKVSKQLMTSENVQITRADNATYTYDGDPKRPAVSKVVYNGKELLSGVDYSVAYEDNINAGEAAIVIKGQGAYAGEARQAFSIAPLNISDEGAQAAITGVPESQAFTGAAIRPAVAVTLGDDVLAKDVDYTVAYGENTNVTTDDAKATVTVSGTGNYTGTTTATFDITARAITDATIEPIASTTYNSHAQTPAPVVKLDGQTIDSSNYTVDYKDNTNVGTATVTVVGGSNFAQGDDNKLITAFAIAPARIDSVTGVSNTLEYTGSDLTFPSLTVRSGLLTLAPNDYTVAYENNRNVGKAKVTVTAQGNYIGGGSFEFRITPKPITDYGVVMPSNDGIEIIYTETANLDAFEPTPIVQNAAGDVLDPSNYDVTYLNNSVAGTAQVIVTGKGNYTGSPSKPGEFTIVKFAGTAASDQNNAVIWYVEDGGAMTITPKKKSEGANLDTASNLTWSQAVADYTTTVTVDSNVQNCQDASGMFSGLSNATSVDISSFNMQQVTSTSGMFEDCASLATIDLTDKIGSSVTDMSRMFAGCESLTSIPLGTVDTSNVTNMSGMFADCASLSVNDLSELFLPSVSASSLSNETEGSGTPLLSTQGISAMSATGALNTENVTSMSEMFKGATGLTELDLNMLDTASVQDMSRMFAGCTNLRMLNIASFNTQSVNDMAGMYDECALNEYTIGSNYVSEQNNVVEALPTPTASNGLWWKTGTAAGNNGNCKWISDDGIRALGVNANDTYANTGNLSAADVSIESADIATSGSSYTYDGSAKEPVVNRVVLKTSDGEEIELIPNADYEVSYNNNVNAGESAQVVVMGRGDYNGSAVQLFAIDKCDICSATVTAENTAYTGSKATPAVTVTIGNKTLAKDTDYTVSCDSVNVGAGVVTITGKGNYKGTNSAKFKIQAFNRWLKEGDSWYYYGADGNRAKGWQKVGSSWYYLDPATGAMRSGWLRDGGKWYYLDPANDSRMATGWCKVNGYWYLFAGGGQMLSGWQRSGSSWYYLNPANDSRMATGWLKVNGWWYLFAAGGQMLSGWQRSGNSWYYLNPANDSRMATGWLKVNGWWYLFASGGQMLSGWQRSGNSWYYLNPSNDSRMATGWCKVGGTWYYFNGSGVMVTGRQYIGGKWYTFNSSGAWVA